MPRIFGRRPRHMELLRCAMCSGDDPDTLDPVAVHVKACVSACPASAASTRFFREVRNHVSEVPGCCPTEKSDTANRLHVTATFLMPRFIWRISFSIYLASHPLSHLDTRAEFFLVPRPFLVL